MFQFPAGVPTQIALIDCANFYASCGRVYESKLTGPPILVLSANHGCVVAASPESKALDPEIMGGFVSRSRDGVSCEG